MGDPVLAMGIAIMTIGLLCSFICRCIDAIEARDEIPQIAVVTTMPHCQYQYSPQSGTGAFTISRNPICNWQQRQQCPSQHYEIISTEVSNHHEPFIIGDPGTEVNESPPTSGDATSSKNAQMEAPSRNLEGDFTTSLLRLP